MQAQSSVRQPVSLEKAEPIHIALASDGRFFPGLRVTAASLACYASREAELVLHILDGGIPDEAFENLRVLLGRIHPQATPRRHRISDEALKDCPEYRGSRLTYARLLLPALLPDVRHIIYCDCDFLWRADIADLWRERNDSIILQSTRDGAAETEAVERRWFARHGYTFESPAYFCAGLMICNLELFRTRGISKQAFDFLRRHPDVNRADQTALNVLLSRETRLLPHTFGYYDEAQMIRDVLAGCNESTRRKLICLTDKIFPTRARIVLGNGLFSITGRMHAAVSTFQMGKPAICITYSKKYDGVIGQNLGRSDLLVDGRRPQCWLEGRICPEVMERVNYVFAQQVNLTHQIQRVVPEQKRLVARSLEQVAFCIQQRSSHR
jgi:hypothetical protein